MLRPVNCSRAEKRKKERACTGGNQLSVMAAGIIIIKREREREEVALHDTKTVNMTPEI